MPVPLRLTWPSRSPAATAGIATRLWIMAPGSNSVTVAVKGRQGSRDGHRPGGRGTQPATADAAHARHRARRVGHVPLRGHRDHRRRGGAGERAAARRNAQRPAPAGARAARWREARSSSGSCSSAGGRGGTPRTVAFRSGCTGRLPPRRRSSMPGRVEPSGSRSPTPPGPCGPTRSGSGQHHQRAWPPLVTDHGKLMHLFLIRQSDMGAFAHLHPTTADSVRFDAPLPALPAGRYRLFADIVHESGFAKTLVASVDLPAPSPGARGDSAGDDGLFLGSAAADARDAPRRRDHRMGSGDRAARGGRARRRCVSAVREADGKPAVLEPYLGMAGHAVVARDDGAVFIHLHPMGTVSTAAQATFTLRRAGRHGDRRDRLPHRGRGFGDDGHDARRFPAGRSPSPTRFLSRDDTASGSR